MSELGAVVPDSEPAKGPEARIVTGQNVTLRPLEESHYSDLWLSVGSHDEVFTHWPSGPYSEPSKFSDDLKGISISESNLAIWTVFKGDEALGLAFLQGSNLNHRVAEIGFLYGPSAQRTSATTETAYLLLCIAFDELNNRRVQWKTSHTNLSSQRAAERLGLPFEGRMRQCEIQKGRNRDTMWYSMIDGEWPVRKRAFETWLREDNFDEQGRQRRRLDDIRRDIAQGT